MIVAYYAAQTVDFLRASDEQVLGALAQHHQHALEHQQRNAWMQEIRYLRQVLAVVPDGFLFLEFSIPRVGKRADAVVIHGAAVYVLEFKVGSKSFDRYALDQVHDYALDLKNFHAGSHDRAIVPVLIATEAKTPTHDMVWAADGVATPVLIGRDGLAAVFDQSLPQTVTQVPLLAAEWATSGYRPTPTIIEAAEALYRQHAVVEIARSDAGAKNLQETAHCIAQVIEASKRDSKKSICFVTGVPGAGKTLAGLNIATLRKQGHQDEHAVFLSGNGALVDVLREALTRDQVSRENCKKTDAERPVRQFIQNIHHFRDLYVDTVEIPFEKVVVFDEAQRAWNRDQASKFMQTKRGHADFNMSEPEFLISVMDRHPEWCTVICLIGGGQEINTGEAGLSEWLSALRHRFPHWAVYASTVLADPHYALDDPAKALLSHDDVQKLSDLHLSVSLRSFRAEQLSAFVSEVLDGTPQAAAQIYHDLGNRYPIAITRDLAVARTWVRSKARGSERYGMLASSGALRLRPEGVHVKAAIDPANWFLNPKGDVRASCALEEVATQFDVQGLELDWAVVCWDLDVRRTADAWAVHRFSGTKWQAVADPLRRRYLLNTYRVLMTRARQGFVLFVPKGDPDDPSRPPAAYDALYATLRACGIPDVVGV